MKKHLFVGAPMVALLVACSGGAGTNPLDLSGSREGVESSQDSANRGGSTGEATTDPSGGSSADQGNGSSNGSGSGQKPDGKPPTTEEDSGSTVEIGPKCIEYYNCCIKIAGEDASLKSQCESIKSGGAASEDSCDAALKGAKEAGRC